MAILAFMYSLSGSDAEGLKYADLAVELAYPKDKESLASVYSDAALRAGRYAEAAEIAVKALDVSDPEQARTAEVIKLVHAALANPGQRASALAAQGRLYPPLATARLSAADLTNVGPCLESSFRYALLGAWTRPMHWRTSASIASPGRGLWRQIHHPPVGTVAASLPPGPALSGLRDTIGIDGILAANTVPRMIAISKTAS